MEPPDHNLLCFLLLMGNAESFRSVADQFGISKRSLHRNICHISEALLFISSDYIKWPTTDVQRQSITKGFPWIPGVIGCEDGTWIPMTGKSGDKRDAYICLKAFHPCMHRLCALTSYWSLTSWLVIRVLFTMHVFCNSSLYASLQLLPMQYHVPGNSAYPPDTFILTPFRDNGHLNAVEKHYNYMQ